jgi:hypothetical protein
MFFEKPVNPGISCGRRGHLQNFNFFKIQFQTATNMVCFNAHVGGMAVEQTSGGLPGWPGPSRNLLAPPVVSVVLSTKNISAPFRVVKKTSDGRDDGDDVERVPAWNYVISKKIDILRMTLGSSSRPSRIVTSSPFYGSVPEH